jgi:hypothetical protein
MTDTELKEHFDKVDKLVNYYMDNMDEERGTIQEALENLFSDLGGSDMARAMDTLKRKQSKHHNAILNV